MTVPRSSLSIQTLVAAGLLLPSRLALAGPCPDEIPKVREELTAIIANYGANTRAEPPALDPLLAAVDCAVRKPMLPADALRWHVAVALTRSLEGTDAALAQAEGSLRAARALSPWLPGSIPADSWPARTFAEAEHKPPAVPMTLGKSDFLLVDGVWTNLYDPTRPAIAQIVHCSNRKGCREDELSVLATRYVFDSGELLALLADYSGAADALDALKAEATEAVKAEASKAADSAVEKAKKEAKKKAEDALPGGGLPTPPISPSPGG